MCSTVYAVTRFYLHNISRYNNLVFPVATYTAFVIFVFSYSVIFVELRKTSKRKTQKSSKVNSRVNVAAGATSKDETKTEVLCQSHLCLIKTLVLSRFYTMFLLMALLKHQDTQIQEKLRQFCFFVGQTFMENLLICGHFKLGGIRYWERGLYNTHGFVRVVFILISRLIRHYICYCI